MDRSRRRIEETGLRRTRRRGLPRAQLQHLQQARVFCPQPRQLRGHSRRNLRHAHNICNPRHVTRGHSARAEGHSGGGGSPACLPDRPLGLVCEMTTSQKGTRPVAAIAEHDGSPLRCSRTVWVRPPGGRNRCISLAQPLTAPSGYQRTEQRPVRDCPSETFCARPGPAWTPLGQARNRQGCAPCRVRAHAALTVRDVQDA
jgi:hypothetical protein